MARQPKTLSAIDPFAVPLPHGTEVTTRVERLVGDRRVPQGVVGRVVAIRDDGLDVQVVGVGVVSLPTLIHHPFVTASHRA